MKHLAAYMLLSLAGKTPDAKSITSLLGTVGIEADPDRINSLLTELSDKELNEVIAEGTSKLASVPSGGAVSSGGAGGGGASASSAPAEETKKEEAKEEAAEESDEDMGFGLFD